MNILDKLNEAGEALKAAGEESIVLSFHAKGQLFLKDRFGIRLELSGGPGVHGSGETVAEAYQNALAQREEDRRRADVEARIRAQVEAEMTGEERKAA